MTYEEQNSFLLFALDKAGLTSGEADLAVKWIRYAKRFYVHSEIDSEQAFLASLKVKLPPSQIFLAKRSLRLYNEYCRQKISA